jgi:hypothetical protein
MRRVIRVAIVACVAATVLAAPGHAQNRRYAYEAELAAAAKAGAARAGGVDWECAGTRCMAEARGGAVSVRGCSELARAVGPVRRYASEIRSLGEKELVECNGAVAAAGTPAAPAAPAAAAKATAPKAAGGRIVTPEMTYTGVWPGGREIGAKQ